MITSLGAAAGRRKRAPSRSVSPDLGLIDVTASPYGCDATGTVDCTEALQRAISDHVGEYSVLYLPPGTYLVSDTLWWRNHDGQFAGKVTLQGAGRDRVRIRLADRAAGFERANAPRAVLFTASDLGDRSPDSGGRDHTRLGEGNEGFRNNILDLSIDTGENRGAVGIDWLAHNNAVIQWVHVRGDGVCGIDMSRRWPGPCLLRDVQITGFDYGVRFRGPESNVACDRVVLRGQERAAIYNSGGGLMAFHRLLSRNSVPALESHDSGTQTVLVDCDLVEGAATTDALVGAAPVTADGVRWRGYRRLRENASGTNRSVVSPRPVRDSGKFDVVSTARDRRPVELGSPDEWAIVTDYGADPTTYSDDTDAVRSALESGARVIAFPLPPDVTPAAYLLSDTVDVPTNVEAVVGWNATIAPLPGSFESGAPRRPLWQISGSAARPLTFRGLRMGLYQGPAPRLDPMIAHDSRRDLVLDRMTVSAATGYRGSVGAGDLYCTDYCCGPVEIAAGQRLWARQLNIEGTSSPQLNIAAGAEAWVLGMKTEQPVTACRVSGRLAMLGGFHSAIRQPPSGTPCIRVDAGGRLWCAYGTSGYLPGAYYQPQIEDVDRTVDRAELRRRGGQGSLVSLYARGD